MNTLSALYVAVTLIGSGISTLRWLRVAQREHYLSPSTTTFALRWWTRGWLNRTSALAAVAATVGSIWLPPLAVVVALIVVVAPRGLGLRGRTSPLAWTRRLRTVALATLVIGAIAIGVGVLTDSTVVISAALACCVPLAVDGALALLAPIERRVAQRYVRAAAATLDRIDPVRVALTGSYGKTTIKGYIRHLVAGSRSVVASPASFNNTAGLSRAINEHLTLDTEVFVAEMGTYGPGEIASMVSWIRPSISMLCAIGPVHLERFGSLDRIVAAKSEIFATSRTAILNVDAHGLAAEADRLDASGIRVIRCSASDPTADVAAIRRDDGIEIIREGRVVISGLDIDAAPTNLACAVAAAAALGIRDEDIAARLPSVPAAEHRRQVAVSPNGVTVVDDTYNSNPAGAAAAVATLERLDANRRVVVTPGMVELGRRQRPENERFAEAAAQVADDLLIVGLTNRQALLFGARDQRARVTLLPDRDAAVAWVRANLRAGDAVLYENDLPDHYP